MLEIRNLGKKFILYNQDSAELEVLRDVTLTVLPGECVVLNGPSGAGKSTLLRCIYGNYHSSAGEILVTHDGKTMDVVTAPPREILSIRRYIIGYVSQFLRVIPRVPTIDVVAEPLRREGVSVEEARQRAAVMLTRLNIPEPLWSLAPATFSGGEQQRVNIARGFIRDFPLLLLDEPTSALDSSNREEVINLIEERKAAGTAMIGIFHDDDVRNRVASRLLEMKPMEKAA